MNTLFIGPHSTPKSVKILIWIICLVSVLAPVTSYFTLHFFKMEGPLNWLALSKSGISQGFIWQFITYAFVNTILTNISLTFFISLFFLMLVLWFAGSEVHYRFGAKSFLTFFLTSTLFAGLIAWLLLFVFSSQTMLAGSAPPIYATLALFAMLYPNLELSFFFFIRIKAKWLVGILIALLFLTSLSSGRFINLAAEVAAIVYAYIFGRTVWKLANPFHLNFPRKRKTSRADKIIDISIIEEEDDAFMDRMLEKIARSGEHSLTHSEKARMQKISDRKKRKS